MWRLNLPLKAGRVFAYYPGHAGRHFVSWQRKIEGEHPESLYLRYIEQMRQPQIETHLAAREIGIASLHQIHLAIQLLRRTVRIDTRVEDTGRSLKVSQCSWRSVD